MIVSSSIYFTLRRKSPACNRLDLSKFSELCDMLDLDFLPLKGDNICL